MTFYPALSYITGITNSQNAVVTFSTNHDFTDGEYISFRVDQQAGMYEINNRRGRVLSHDDTTLTVDIDTTTWNAFINNSPITEGSPPLAVPAGSGILPDVYPATVSLIDSFDDRP